jgi:alpha-beta hydrolase superfamily lysophospholipase
MPQPERQANLKHTDGYFQGIRNTRIYYQYWSPSGAFRANLLVVHGLAEHSGRYMNLVNRFVPMGYAVYGFDHIGHGKSGGRRCYVQRFQDFIETLKNYVDRIRGLKPGVPLFLVGHSMGGLIAASYLLDPGSGVSGAILSGPGIKAPGSLSGTLIFIGKVLSVLTPKAPIIQLDAENISRDPAVVNAYRNDPLVYTGKITARLGAEMLKAMQYAAANAGSITLPLMIVQGGADKLVDPAGAQLLYDRVSSKDKSIRIYESLFHEVFNEPEREQVLNDVEHWLQARTG